MTALTSILGAQYARGLITENPAIEAYDVGQERDLKNTRAEQQIDAGDFDLNEITTIGGRIGGPYSGVWISTKI